MTCCPTDCNGQVLKPQLELLLKPGDTVYAILLTPEWEECICTTLTPSQRLAEEAQAQQAHPPGSTVPECYKDFADVFSEEAFAHLPPCKAWDHTIELHPDAKLPRGRTFPLSPAEQKELDAFLRENLANRRIHPLKSLIGAPVFFVKKKEGSLHLVQDYQKLNKITVKNSYPLPLVSNMLTRLRDVEWFTTLDLHWGFNNVRLKEGDEWKAAFSMNCGLFEPLVMFFGLCNSPTTFQTMMNDILCPFIDRNEAICYMDDILIYSASLTDHQRITQEILQTLRSYKLFLQPEKCKFKHREVDYLGLVISKDHVAMDPIKVQGVTDWPQPTKVKDVQSFIGFVNFYQRFIHNFSEIACPLHVLTHKSKDWSWGAAEQQAFDALKSAVTSTPTPAFPSKSSPFHLECNASNFATGAILSQQQEDRLSHLIGFMSKSFSNMERNYQIHDKEMLVIMCALEEWRHFLKGSDQKFEIHTDHKNLSYFQEAHKLNHCQA